MVPADRSRAIFNGAATRGAARGAMMYSMTRLRAAQLHTAPTPGELTVRLGARGEGRTPLGNSNCS